MVVISISSLRSCNAFDGRHALFGAPHQHNALHNVVGVVLAGNAQAWLETDLCGCDILHQDGIASDLRQHRIVEVVDRSDEADTAHDRGLGTEIDRIAANVDVAVIERLQHLWKRQAVSHELVEIHLQLEDFGFPAPSRHIDHSRHCPKAPLQDPVLQCLEIHDAVAGRPDKPIAIDFANRADRGNPGLNSIWQRGEL